MEGDTQKKAFSLSAKSTPLNSKPPLCQVRQAAKAKSESLTSRAACFVVPVRGPAVPTVLQGRPLLVSPRSNNNYSTSSGACVGSKTKKCARGQLRHRHRDTPPHTTVAASAATSQSFLSTPATTSTAQTVALPPWLCKTWCRKPADSSCTATQKTVDTAHEEGR